MVFNEVEGHSIKTLIIRLSSIGDIVLTTPFLRRLHSVYPKADITYVTRKEFAPLLEQSPYVNTVIPLDITGGKEAMRTVRATLRDIPFEYVFDLHNNHRSRFLRKGLSGALRVYTKAHWKWMLLVALHWNTYKKIVPVPERYIRSAQLPAMNPDALPPELTLPVETGSAFSSREPGEIRIAICPGAKHATKRYPEEQMHALTRLLLDNTAYRIAVLGGKEDQRIGEALQAIDASRIASYCGKLSLIESAAALQQCNAAITNDSGLMHIATAVKTPVVALFGSTVREFGFFPYNAPAAILETEGLSCRPCTHIGRASCPRGHFKCMMEIPPESVFHALQELFSAPPQRPL